MKQDVMATTLLSLENASFSYSSAPSWEGINMKIHEGEWISLLGPNGGGKTTLLKALLGIIPLQKGKRLSTSKSFGYVPQKFQIPNRFPLTLQEFLEFKDTEAEEGLEKKQQKILSDLNLKGLLDRPLQNLSGGELQKSLLAFSLWDQPKILFLDEFLEGLDTQSMNNILGYLEYLHSEEKLSIVEASHDLTAVTHTASRVLLLQGRVVYDGSPKDHGFHDCLHQIYGHHKWIKHDHA